MESLRKCPKFGIYMSVLIPTNILKKISSLFLIKYDIFIYVFLSCEHRLPFLHRCTFIPWIIFFNFFPIPPLILFGTPLFVFLFPTNSYFILLRLLILRHLLFHFFCFMSIMSVLIRLLSASQYCFWKSISSLPFCQSLSFWRDIPLRRIDSFSL